MTALLSDSISKTLFILLALLTTNAAQAVTITRTFSPTAYTRSESEPINPLMGQYTWEDQPQIPTNWSAPDVYNRWSWKLLEPTKGNYDFSLIDTQIAKAKAQKGRFGMRVVAVSSCVETVKPLDTDCSTPVSTGVYAGKYSAIPDYLVTESNAQPKTNPYDNLQYMVPNWNSNAYLTRLEALLTAIKTRYANEPYFAFVDMNGYGNWGEMHMFPFSDNLTPPITDPYLSLTSTSAQRIVTANTNAFSNKFLVSLTAESKVLQYAMNNPAIGLRVDCLGLDRMGGAENAMSISNLPQTTVTLVENRWKTAPFITEFCPPYSTSLPNNYTNTATVQACGISQNLSYYQLALAQVKCRHISMVATNGQPDPRNVTGYHSVSSYSGYRLRVKSMTLSFDTLNPSVLTVQSQWLNENVAPTYLNWDVRIELWKSPYAAGQAVPVARLTNYNLRTILPGVLTSFNQTVTMATPLAPGTYDVMLRVNDPQGISPTMNLAMQGRQNGGSYLLGQITW